jgi:hypothetical protein
MGGTGDLAAGGDHGRDRGKATGGIEVQERTRPVPEQQQSRRVAIEEEAGPERGVKDEAGPEREINPRSADHGRAHRQERAGATGARRRRGRGSGGGWARRQETEAGGGGGYERSKTYCSDTMLGIDKLYSLGAKGHNI